MGKWTHKDVEHKNNRQDKLLKDECTSQAHHQKKYETTARKKAKLFNERGFFFSVFFILRTAEVGEKLQKEKLLYWRVINNYYIPQYKYHRINPQSNNSTRHFRGNVSVLCCFLLKNLEKKKSTTCRHHPV